jgi:hypothetical protein
MTILARTIIYILYTASACDGGLYKQPEGKKHCINRWLMVLEEGIQRSRITNLLLFARTCPLNKFDQAFRRADGAICSLKFYKPVRSLSTVPQVCVREKSSKKAIKP